MKSQSPHLGLGLRVACSSIIILAKIIYQKACSLNHQKLCSLQRIPHRSINQTIQGLLPSALWTLQVKTSCNPSKSKEERKDKLHLLHYPSPFPTNVRITPMRLWNTIVGMRSVWVDFAGSASCSTHGMTSLERMRLLPLKWNRSWGRHRRCVRNKRVTWRMSELWPSKSSSISIQSVMRSSGSSTNNSHSFAGCWMSVKFFWELLLTWISERLRIASTRMFNWFMLSIRSMLTSLRSLNPLGKGSVSIFKI